jgi:hypothetical protein
MKYEKFESLSNIIYPLVGLVGFIFNGHVGFFFGMTILGVGSYYYHRYKEAQVMDIFGIATAFTATMGTIINDPLVWGLLILILGVYGFAFLKRFSTNVEVGFFAGSTFIIAILFNGLAHTILPILIFSLAFGLKQRNKVAKEEHHDSIEHSVWHILTGIGFYLLL